MDHLGTLNAFVHAAETGSFVGAGRATGLSSSAVGKAVARLETRLGVRLFHRNTRNMTLTDEGRIFLDRCRRIFEEVDAAEFEMAQTAVAPSGRLRVSLPLVSMLLTPVIADFMDAYPAIQLDLDFADRLVDVIEEGFDVVVRTGPAKDSRLMRRSLGYFKAKLVASPEYLATNGVPETPQDLLSHRCLRQRLPGSGKLHEWRFHAADVVTVPETTAASAIEPLILLAERGLGIACMPPFAVEDALRYGRLVSIMEDRIAVKVEFAALWPTSRQLSPKIRAFVSHLADNLRLER